MIHQIAHLVLEEIALPRQAAEVQIHGVTNYPRSRLKAPDVFDISVCQIEKFDPNDWQGRRKEQVTFSETVAAACLIIAILLVITHITLKIIF